MKNNPRVSVLIPTYNDAEYLPDAINSILVQTFDDFELIIVDDGSTDNTRELLSTYNDQRLKILSLEKNCGRPTARNIALDAAGWIVPVTRHQGISAGCEEGDSRYGGDK